MEIKAHCRLACPIWWRVYTIPRRADGSPQRVMYVVQFKSTSTHHIRALSSVGQSLRLITGSSSVRTREGLPYPCIAQRQSGGFMLRFGTRLVRGSGFESQYRDHMAAQSSGLRPRSAKPRALTGVSSNLTAASTFNATTEKGKKNENCIKSFRRNGRY